MHVDSEQANARQRMMMIKSCAEQLQSMDAFASCKPGTAMTQTVRLSACMHIGMSIFLGGFL
jgi:hypothetical protein